MIKLSKTNFLDESSLTISVTSHSSYQGSDMSLESFTRNCKNFFSLNNHNESLSIDSFALSSANFSELSEKHSDISLKLSLFNIIII